MISSARSYASAVFMFIALLLPAPAHRVLAADITVDSNCSLADAIQAAESDSEVGGCPAGDGADTIHLSGDVTLAAELPQITSDITIAGGGYTISGDNSFRIFYIADGALTMNQLTLTNGTADEGGAIKNDGTLMISNSSFSDNAVELFGGAIFNDGALRVTDTKFTNNQSQFGGGAIANRGSLDVVNSSYVDNLADFGGGGAISNIGALNITNSSFMENSTDDGSGGAIRNLAGQSNIIDSIFVDNRAEDDGGAIANVGAYGGPYGELIVTGSTFAGNRAEIGGGGAISSTDYNKLSIANSSFTNNFANISGGAIVSYGELSVVNSTLTGNSSDGDGGGLFLFSLGTNTFAHLTLTNNTADEGGGIYVRQVDKAVNLYNSLISGNEGGDCAGKQLSAIVGNFIADGSCDSAISGDPMLGALVESEDGSTAYFPLLPGSPAIDAADPDHCTPTDQTGTARPQGEACDIGAYEFKRD